MSSRSDISQRTVLALVRKIAAYGRWLGVVLLSGVAVACSGAATEPLPVTLGEKLQAALDEGFAQTTGKGVSVAVVIPGEPMWTGSAGVSHGAVPITEKSVFAAGSITKTFTAVTILRLAEEGYLSVDDSLHAWLPPYPDVDPDITIRQLLNHTSGLSDLTHPGWFIPLLQEPTRVWGMEEYFLHSVEPPLFPKGTGWSYSTSGYLLLRMIIEKATGSTVASQYKKYVLGPLGLRDTYVCPDDALPSGRVHGWVDITGDGVADDFDFIPKTAWCSAVGGQIFTTAADLATLGKALMQERTLLSSASYDEMTDFILDVGTEEPLVHGYGLGLLWFNSAFMAGQKAWGHGGNAVGYSAGLIYMVDHGAIVSIMDNTDEGEAMGVLGGILNVVVAHTTSR